MKRSRRARILGWAWSFAVHLFAFVVLTRVVTPHIRTRLADTRPMQVQLIRMRDGLGRPAPKAPPDASSKLAPPTPGTPELETDEAAPDPLEDNAAPSVVAQDAPVDIDPLFRVPFLNAAGQAEAALRAGLGCAHVDLQQLSRTLLDQCAAADRSARAGKRGAPAEPSQPEVKA